MIVYVRLAVLLSMFTLMTTSSAAVPASTQAFAVAALKDDPLLAANDAPRLARLAAVASGDTPAPAKP